MLLSYTELVQLVKDGRMEGVRSSAINAASIDVHLGDTFLRERQIDWRACEPVDLAARESIEFDTCRNSIVLMPQEFTLAHTMEKFFLPDDISAELSLKSSIARNALEHLNACWVDAGFTNSVLTLELKNVTRYHRLRLSAGMPIGQVKFFRHTEVPEEQSYRRRGRYNNDESVAGCKP